MTTPSEHNPWIRNFHPAPDAHTKLVCFPHAGGSASYFFPLSKALAPEFDVYVVQYPGHQDRYKEPFIDNIDGMADEAFSVLEPLTETPVALFGHSMGAVLAFEVARRMETSTGRLPAQVFVSGSRAPSRYDREANEGGDDAALVGEMRKLGGTDPRVLNNPDMLATILPAFRNDYRALQRYHRGTEVGIGAPVVVMAATDDPKSSVTDARAWLEHTSGGGDLHTFEGGHFYLEKQSQKVIEVIAEKLRASEQG